MWSSILSPNITFNALPRNNNPSQNIPSYLIPPTQKIQKMITIFFGWHKLCRWWAQCINWSQTSFFKFFAYLGPWLKDQCSIHSCWKHILIVSFKKHYVKNFSRSSTPFKSLKNDLPFSCCQDRNIYSRFGPSSSFRRGFMPFLRLVPESKHWLRLELSPCAELPRVFLFSVVHHRILVLNWGQSLKIIVLSGVTSYCMFKVALVYIVFMLFKI